MVAPSLLRMGVIYSSHISINNFFLWRNKLNRKQTVHFSSFKITHTHTHTPHTNTHTIHTHTPTHTAHTPHPHTHTHHTITYTHTHHTHTHTHTNTTITYTHTKHTHRVGLLWTIDHYVTQSTTYPKQPNTKKRPPCNPAGFEPTIETTEWPQTARQPPWARASSFTRFLDHTQRRTTVSTTPLDEWSARRRDLYLTTHNTHNRQTSMPTVGFEPTIAAIK